MNIIETLVAAFNEACESRNTEPPPILTDDMVLLESGLDSLGFAILVTNLEIELGYDPFTLMEEPFYPRAFGELLEIYERFKDHRVS